MSCGFNFSDFIQFNMVGDIVINHTWLIGSPAGDIYQFLIKITE
jgi:hypothetical protein